MKITSNLRFLYIFDGSGLLCGVVLAVRAPCSSHQLGKYAHVGRAYTYATRQSILLYRSTPIVVGKGGKKGGSVQHKASFFFFFYILCLSEQLVWTLVASAGKNFPLFFPKFYFDGHAFTTLLLRSDCVKGCLGRLCIFQFPDIYKIEQICSL